MRNIIATGEIYGQTVTLQQISKGKARKLFADGKTIYLQSSNLFPFGVWQNAMPVKKDIDYKFESVVNNFSYYNTDSERGKYVTFYANAADL